jgi:hypothetical protein
MTLRRRIVHSQEGRQKQKQKHVAGENHRFIAVLVDELTDWRCSDHANSWNNRYKPSTTGRYRELIAALGRCQFAKPSRFAINAFAICDSRARLIFSFYLCSKEFS